MTCLITLDLWGHIMAGAHGGADHSPHGWGIAKRKRKRPGTHNPPWGHVSNNLKHPTSLHLLKVLPLPNNTMLETKYLLHLGDI